MPLYSDSNYYYSSGNSQLFSPYYTGSSSSSIYSPYSSYNRPYAGSYIIPLTSSRSNSYGNHSSHSSHGLSSLRYQPKLTTITESSASSNLMPLTRIQSPKYNPYTVHNPVHTPKYTPPRPILINTADIDVTANRYRKRKQQAELDEKQRQRTIESYSPRTSIKMEANTTNETDFNKTLINNLNNYEKIDEQHKGRSTIRRNRTVVRLSTVRSRSKGPKSTLLMNTKDNCSINDTQKAEENIDNNITTDMKEEIIVPLDITTEPIITFHDICEDISSDKIDDDLNAGELRRRASLICLQDQDLLNQLQILERRNSHETIDEADKKINTSENLENISSTVKASNAILSEQNPCAIPETINLSKKKKRKSLKVSNAHKQEKLLSSEGKKKVSPKKKITSKKETSPEVFKFDVKSVQELNKEYEQEEQKYKCSTPRTEHDKLINSLETVCSESSSVQNIHTPNKNSEILPLKSHEKVMKTIAKTSNFSSSVDVPSTISPHNVLEKSISLTGIEISSPILATPKSIQKVPLKKIDNDTDNDGEDFWARIGTRETVYIANRRKNILRNHSSKSEDLADSTLTKSSNKTVDVGSKLKEIFNKQPITDDVDLRKNLLEKNVQKKLLNRSTSETTYSNLTTFTDQMTLPSKDKLKTTQSEPPSQISSPTPISKLSKSSTNSTETQKTSSINSANVKPNPIMSNKDKLTLNSNNITKSSTPTLLVQTNAPIVKTLNRQLRDEEKDESYKISKPVNTQISLHIDVSTKSMPEEKITTPSKITGHLAKSSEQNQEACKQDNKRLTIETKNNNNNNNNNNENNKSNKYEIASNKNFAKDIVENQQKYTINEIQEGKVVATTVATTKQPETLQLTQQLLERTINKANKTKTSNNDIETSIASTTTTVAAVSTAATATTTTTTTTTTNIIKTKCKVIKNSSPLKAKTKTSPGIINAEQFIAKAPNKLGTSPTKSLITSPTTSTIEKVNRKSIDKQHQDKTSSLTIKETIESVITTTTTATTTVINANDTITTPVSATTTTTTTKISSATTCENKSGIRDISIASGNNNNLTKFATVSNLAQCLRDVDADLDDYVPSSEEFSDTDDNENNNSNSDLDLSSIDGWDNFSVSMKKKLRHQHKKAKQLAGQQAGFDPQKKMKIDTTRKLYVKEEAPRYPLVATPRPLWKREKIIYNNDDADTDDSDNDSDGSTEETETSDECNTSEEYDDDLNTNIHHNNNKSASGIIRMSTSSNDSGFEGGTAPTSPKRMLECDVNCHKKCERLTANLCGVNQKLIVEALASLKKAGGRDIRDSPSTPPSLNPAYKIETNEEQHKQNEQHETSYTYAEFQKSGRFTTPATIIPRFKNYSVDDFHFLAVLGKGSFGKVLLAELRDTTYYYAIKCLKKDVVLEDDDVDSTLIERKVLALGTNHPYLCHLFCTFQTESHLFFVMEYLNGGDLMFHIQESGRFPEERARFYGAEIISGLKFLHKKGIIYRDLKLDNVLLDYEGHVRIADFGMCKLQIYLDKTADSFCGTPDYMAPEIIKGENYNQNVDWWSFGVLLYEMLIGQSPFSGCDEDELFWSICNEIPWFPVYITTEATSILKGLLEKDHNKRIGSHYSLGGDICHHVFFRAIDWELLEKRLIPPPFRPLVKHPLDTQYFDKVFTRERVRLTPIDKDILQSIDQKQFLGFTYTNPHITLD